ncbi:MAG: endopeptidase La [Ruminococcaceae bacterium]|nr:endopeptidase La [Oscillospiraceae bacterium]
MSRYIEKAEQITLPVIALRGIVAFPGITVNCEVEKDSFNSPAAAQSAASSGELVLLASFYDIAEPDTDAPNVTKLYPVATVAKIKQLIRTPDGSTRLIAEGQCRASLISVTPLEKYTVADAIAKTVVSDDNGGITGEAYLREANMSLQRIVRHIPAVADDIMTHARTIKNPGQYADFVAANILTKYEDKQSILACFEPMARIDTLILIMNHEAEILGCESEIHKRVRDRMNKNQRDYYLREEMKVIQDELGEGADTDEYAKRILKADLPTDVEQKLMKENEKLSRLPFGSAESSVITAYLDTCLDIPWSKSTRDRVDIASAKKILDDDHDGLEKVKERILEFLAVKQLSPELKNQIICLVGPPGVGKTSIASSIARALKRKYVRVSLGGVRDESDIRGHRKTYIGAMPGRIITALTQAKVSNPLILLDEIDKLTRDAHGDPSSALLEVLDPEQNKFFRDHYVEMPFDLSECLFIATANSLDTIPRPLIDRMEIIELNSYTRREKYSIAVNHLIPKQMKKHGLNRRRLKISEDAIYEIIDYYTREAGVRNLERNIAALCRKSAKFLIENPDKKQLTVTERNIKDLLGARKRFPDKVFDTDEVGVVNGLAYTEAGGDMLRVEVAVLDGTGKLELTGSLGDVMKESAHAALTYARSIASKYAIPSDFYQKKDIHVHVPEGAVPKDGPSAGVTMMTALISALSGIPVRRDVAMTGEITLRGRVLAIGGLKEKTMAAYSAGVKTVLIPHDNLSDLDEIDPLVRESITFMPCKTADDVLAVALARTEHLREGDCRITVEESLNTNDADSSLHIPNIIKHDNGVPASRRCK